MNARNTPWPARPSSPSGTTPATRNESDALVTDLLVLPDGEVLASNLTPEMETLLLGMDLRRDRDSQCILARANTLRDGLGVPAGPTVTASSTPPAPEGQRGNAP